MDDAKKKNAALAADIPSALGVKRLALKRVEGVVGMSEVQGKRQRTEMVI